MRRAGSLVLIALVMAAASSACGGSPTQPPPIVDPPPPPPQQPPQPPPAAPPPTLEVTKILAFGDSMTEGTTSAPLAGWRFVLDPGRPASYPFKLQTLITARYTSQTIAVYNAGKAGERASEAGDRFDRALREANPDVVLLLEGANDLNNGAGISATTNAMEDMVRLAREQRGKPVFLATLPPQRSGGKGRAELVAAYNDSLKGMAARKGAIVVDIGAQFPLSLIGTDGLHPTEDGYQRFAEIWLDALKARYEKAPEPFHALHAPASGR